MAVAAVMLPVVAGACGSSSATAEPTMPPLLTTTTTSTTVYVPTTVPQVTSYVVQAGDTLSKIAGRFGVKAADIMALNGITKPDHIERGQKLKIPPPSADPTTSAKPTGKSTTSTAGG
jgi:N-acetylmuramoyl-L-alanine amidase